MGVEVIKCPNCNMRYNASVYTACPFCQKETGKTSEGPKTKPDIAEPPKQEKSWRPKWGWGDRKNSEEKPSINPIVETGSETVSDQPAHETVQNGSDTFSSDSQFKDENNFIERNPSQGREEEGKTSKTKSIWQIKATEGKTVERSVNSGYDNASAGRAAEPVREKEVQVDPAREQISQEISQQEPAPSVASRIQSISKTTAKYISVSGGEVSYPAVGWLVCVKGVYYGQSFPLRTGRNHVGRSADMEVALLRDNSVSSKNVVSIVYDGKGNVFSALPGESSSLCYINGEAVYERVILHGYEEIELGDSEKNMFIFVPFCGERFRWSMYENIEE